MGKRYQSLERDEMDVSPLFPLMSVSSGYVKGRNGVKVDNDFDSLPPGHYGRDDALTALHNEYDSASAVEKKWLKRIYHYSPISPKDGVALANILGYSLGEKRNIVTKITYNPNLTPKWADATYSRWGKEIEYRGYLSLRTLVHEATHYFSRRGHGEEFCAILDLMYEALEREMRANPEKWQRVK